MMQDQTTPSNDLRAATGRPTIVPPPEDDLNDMEDKYGSVVSKLSELKARIGEQI